MNYAYLAAFVVTACSMLCYMRIKQLNKRPPKMTLNLYRPNTGSCLTLYVNMMDDCELWDFLTVNYPGWKVNTASVEEVDNSR